MEFSPGNLPPSQLSKINLSGTRPTDVSTIKDGFFYLNPPVGGFIIRLLTDKCNWVHSPPLVENPPFGVAAK